MIKKSIPNFITLLNMLCGLIAIIFIFEGELWVASMFVALAALFDFLDGMMARLLNARSSIGKELDSLSDVVSFGVVPGLMVFKMLENSNPEWLMYIALMIPLFAGLRLAKFNIDTRQTDSFLGLPTPACALFFCSMPLIDHFSPNSFMISFIHSQWTMLGAIVLISLLMVSELPLFALKLKGFSFKKNTVPYLFIIGSIVAITLLGFSALPIIIIGYVIVSLIINNLHVKDSSDI